MKCLVIAAGKGSRLRQRGDSKPLIPILGLPLVERVIRSAIKIGIDDFYVVSGYNGEGVRNFLDDLALSCNVSITNIVNEDWEKQNGISVLKAENCLDEPFLLLMADHLFDPEILRDLLQQPPGEGEITLAVDRDITNPFIDLDDVTGVLMEEGKVSGIGKGLESFNGFDTGIFLCTPAIFKALKRSVSENGDDSLSGGVRRLAAEGKVNAFDIQGRFWIDVDDPGGFARAENALLGQLGGKPNDGPVSRYLNRPLSIRISRYLVKTTSLTPNQISFASFLFSILAAVLFAAGGYLALASGALLAQFASVIDGCDGEVARLKFRESDFGGWFDAVLDRYADAFLLFGLTWHIFASVSGGSVSDGSGSGGLGLLVGFLAIIGSFMNSYTADKYDNLMRARFESGVGFRIGRDVRVFIIFIGALLNLPFLTLLVIAVMTNAETIRRVIVCRNNG